MCHRNTQPPTENASIHSTDQTLFSGPGNETISPSLHQRFHDELLSPESTQPERSMFQVELSKHPQLGVGITIVGGSNKNGYGIFVKSVTLDGPAFKDGRIKPGDQILEINGSNLSEVQHHDAVKLIKESENTVKFLISQVKPPRSLKHRDNDDAVFQWKLQNSMVSKSIDMEDRESDSSRNSPSNLPVCDELTDSDVNIATVNNSDIDDKKSTKVKNPEKKSPDMDIGDANSPKSVINGADSCNGNSVVAKIHSMLSDDGLQKSEPVASDHVTAPEGDQYCSENESDTETDSDFEEVCTAVIQNRYAAPPLGNTSPTLGKNGEDISPTQGQEEELEVFLEKQNGSFGLNVTGGVNTSVRHGGIYVKSVVANSAAHKDGTILKGDRILEVDSVAMSGLTHREAVQALQDAPPICRLLVSRLCLLKGTSKEQAMEGQIGDTTSLEGCEDDLYGTFVNEENSYSVDLIKGIYGLGFSTVGGQPDSPALSDRVVRIKRVFPIGPARESGKIRSGDVILAVNGQSVTGKSLTEIMSMLRGAGKSVQLLMCHPDPDQLPPLNVLESEESLVVTPSSNRSVVSDTDSEASDDQFQPSYTEEMLSLALYGNHGTMAETGEQNELSAATGINLDGDNGEEDQDNDEEHSDNTETPRSDGVTPPLPTSPPPTLGRTTEGLDMDGYKQGAEFSDEQGVEFTDEQGAELSDEQEESDYEEGNDSPNLHLIDVQVGVAELMDSCHAEMVQIHSAKNLSKLAGMTQMPVSENLIVREDSALTVNSRETTPVANASLNSAEFMPDSSSELSFAKESELEDSEIDASLVHHDETDAEDLTRRSHEDGIIVQSLEDTVLQEMVQQATGSLGSNPTSVSVSSANMVASCSYVDGVKFTGIVDNNVIDISGKYSVNDVCTDAEEQAVNEAADVNIKKILIDKKTSDFDNNEDSESDFDDDDIKQLEKKYMDLEQAEDSENESVSEGSKNEHQENEDNDEGTDETENVEKGTDKDLGTGISYATLMDSNAEEDIVESLRNKNDPESFDFTGLNSDMIQYSIERKPGKSNNEVYSDIDDTDKVNDGESDFDETEEQKDDSEHADNLNDLTDLISEVRRQTVHENDVDEEVEDVDEDRNDVMKNEDGSRVRKESSSQSEVKPLLPGEFEVILAKPEGCGLGFTVAGGANTSGGCYVKAVLANPALSDGRIKTGDKIIMVAGIDMRPLNHFEAVSVLRETEADVTIRLFRPDVAMGDPGQAGVRITSHELTHKHNNRQKTTSEHPECEGDTSHVSSSPENTKKQHKWTFFTDPHTSEDESEAQPESAGLLRDLIHSLEATKSELASPGAGRRSPSLGNPRRAENVLQDRSCVRGGTSPGNRSPGLGEGSVYQIELRKAEGGGGLGISLVTAESTHMTGVFIHTIIPGGLAHRDGRLKEGDKLLQINGESLVGMNHTKAASILRNCEGKLSLTVSRKDRKPSWLEADLESSQVPTENWADTTDPDSCTEFEVSEVNDSSVSISRHVRSDIHDNGIDDLVAGAERVLTMSKKSKHLSRSDENVSDDDDYDDNDGNNYDDDAPPPLPEKRVSNSSHKFLAGTNVISPKPDEISVESGSDSLDEDVENDDDEEFEKLNEDMMNDDDDDFEKLILGDRSSESGDDDEEDEYNATYAMKRFDSSKCWCNNLRTLVMEVPEEITEEWLYTLSLVTVPVGYRAQIPGLVSALQERITLEDPQEEYRQLRDVPLTDMCEAATLIHNRPKNRFRNVLPYDINRVLLESQDSSWDYINASHIQLEVGESVADYIVTQGPLPETTDDFWVMTWQQGVTVVVMLTLEMEGSKVKCHRYWPDSADTSMEVCDGALRLSLLYHNSLADFDVRSLLMEDTSNGDTRIVHHLHYTTWPDHGTPTVARPLLQCMRLSHLLRSEGPLVVHCSAGIGRSGTFIAIDLALAHVENSMQFDIMELVTELRRQRQGMIQTRDQYVFCYTACVEALLETPM
ncbi:hypothetical protein DPMN_181598 [Dreissena polymorpha]|uniref:Tyrosine-protein phosphatase non-receptor type 13 n=1 Tax=Dreissena polymorpha TaxID=45954 RepID=A0A9D4I5G4_DREPO|nr:hypothetical protein DPMN_181598 [Dreissena polymorpha]